MKKSLMAFCLLGLVLVGAALVAGGNGKTKVKQTQAVNTGTARSSVGLIETMDDPAIKLVQMMIDACKSNDLDTAKACFGVESFPIKVNGKQVVENKLDALLTAADFAMSTLAVVSAVQLSDRTLVKTEHTVKGTIGREILETVIFDVQRVNGQQKIMAADAKQVYQ